LSIQFDTIRLDDGSPNAPGETPHLGVGILVAGVEYPNKPEGDKVENNEKRCESKAHGC
jgi:hypothetical protein